MLFLPPEGRNLAVQDFDRPPLGHNRDDMSALANRNTCRPSRYQRWLDIVGADHWWLTMNGWTLLAINAQLPGSGLEAEAGQWSWLGDQLTDHLWAPSTWAVLPDQVQPRLGEKRCGIVSLDLASGTSPEPVLVEPDGIAQLTVGSDIPDPYHR